MQQHRDSTKHNYLAVWKVFNQFFVRLDYKPHSWEDCLNLFIGYLIQNNRKSATVNSYISAVKAVLLMKNIEIEEDRYLLSSLVRACRIKNDVVKTRLPIQKGMLAILLKNILNYFPHQPYLAAFFRAIISTMYFRLLRISEVADGPHHLLARDVHIGQNKKKLLLILCFLKTHGKHMDPQMIKILSVKRNGSQTDDEFVTSLPCPYQLIWIFASMRGGFKMDDEAFFQYSDGNPITPARFNCYLKSFIKYSWFDQNLYSSHSLRAGRSCDLYRLGVSVESIKKIGRW